MHVIDHPDGRVLVDTDMTELHPLLADSIARRPTNLVVLEAATE